MQIIYHGHSFIEIETEQGSVVIDPFVTGNPKCDISLDQLFLKKITHILITHNHDHHIGDALVLAKQFPDSVFVGDSQVLVGFEQQGATNTYGVLIGGICDTTFGSIQAVRAVHDTCDGIALGFIITVGDKIIYHAGDTDFFQAMEELALPKIDVALLPIGGMSTMDVEHAVKAAGLIRAKTVVPIHYDTFSSIKADDLHFAQQIMLKQYGVPKVLRAGQYVVL